MILEFKTSNKNTYSRRKYLCFDTNALVYSTQSHSMIIERIEIKTADYKELIEQLENNEYKKVDYVY